MDKLEEICKKAQTNTLVGWGQSGKYYTCQETKKECYNPNKINCYYLKQQEIKK